MIDTRRLEVLIAVARWGSVSEAAKALMMSQPTASHHLKQLENELGVVLLQRQGRGTVLSPAGRTLAAEGESILSSLQALAHKVVTNASAEGGRVRIASFPSATATIVPRMLGILAKAAPGLVVEIVDAEPHQAGPLLSDGEVDAVLGFSYSPLNSERFTIWPLAYDRLALISTREGMQAVRASAPYTNQSDCADETHLHATDTQASNKQGSAKLDSTKQGSVPQNPLNQPALLPLASCHPVQVAQLAALQDEVWHAGRPRCRGHLLQVCASAGFQPVLGYTSDDSVAVQALIAAGYGVTLLPELVLAAHRHPAIEATVIESQGRDIYLATHGEGPHSPALEQVIAAAQLACREIGLQSTASPS